VVPIDGAHNRELDHHARPIAFARLEDLDSNLVTARLVKFHLIDFASAGSGVRAVGCSITKIWRFPRVCFRRLGQVQPFALPALDVALRPLARAGQRYVRIVDMHLAILGGQADVLVLAALDLHDWYHLGLCDNDQTQVNARKTCDDAGGNLREIPLPRKLSVAHGRNPA